VFIRDMFPYIYVDTRQKPNSLENVFPLLFEFFTGEELGRMTRLSKWFYSEIIVFFRIRFFAMANAANKTILNDDDDDDDNSKNNCDKQEERRTLVIQGKKYNPSWKGKAKRTIIERDEIEVYLLYFSHIPAITSISLPRGYKAEPPAIVSDELKKTLAQPVNQAPLSNFDIGKQLYDAAFNENTEEVRELLSTASKDDVNYANPDRVSE
jgi:hypothetical protein